MTDQGDCCFDEKDEPAHCDLEKDMHSFCFIPWDGGSFCQCKKYKTLPVNPKDYWGTKGISAIQMELVK